MAFANPLSRTSEVTSLTPQGITGRGKVYELTSSSASPTRVTGTDDIGMPIEETIPAAHWREFVGLDGCVKRVPIRTSVPFSMEPEQVRYEQIVTSDIVQAGQLPLDVCPFTGEFGYIQRPKLVQNPNNTPDCGGKPDGCEHMHKLIEARKKNALAVHNREQAIFHARSNEEHQRMADSVGVAVARAMNPQAIANAKARLRDGRSDPEKAGE